MEGVTDEWKTEFW